jgi:DNA-binding MarR family transcriptional regulator
VHSDEELDRLETALFKCMRTAKRPYYWEELQRRADVSIDRPAAAIILSLLNGPLQFQKLVHRLGVEAPSISRKVHELENNNIIKRVPTEDKRIHLLSLTEEGNAIGDNIKRARREMLADILSDWPSGKRHELIALVESLAKAMQEYFGSKDRVV